MDPAIGVSRPIRYRSSVLLPLPDPPRIANVVPRSMTKLTCSISTRVPHPMRRSSTVMCGPAGGIGQTPTSANTEVNSALITITLKIASTTAVVVRAPTAAAPPIVASPCPHAIRPIASARNGVLTRPARK